VAVCAGAGVIAMLSALSSGSVAGTLSGGGRAGKSEIAMGRSGFAIAIGCDPMEVRQLRYAVALAETLHFGRAAERMFITQPAFSQHIARLESELGTPLFERSANRVRLTPAGEAFVARAQRVLAELAATEEEVRDIAGGSAGVLRVGIFAEGAGELMPLIFGAYREAFPRVELRFAELTMGTQVASLVDGAVDVAFLRPPIPDPRVELQALFAEPRVAVLPERHALADADSLSVSDLIDEPFAAAALPAPPRWSSFWCCDDDRGEPGRMAARVGSVGESLAAIAHLGAVDTFPASAARRFSYPGVRYVPLRDGAFTPSAIARRADDDRPLIEGFRAIAARMAERHLAAVPDAVAPEQAPQGTPLPA